MVVVSLALLFVEVVKSTRTTAIEVINHALSMLVFIIALVEFITLPAFATSPFFFLVRMTVFDIVAGFTISIVAAKRDLGVRRRDHRHELTAFTSGSMNGRAFGSARSAFVDAAPGLQRNAHRSIQLDIRSPFMRHLRLAFALALLALPLAAHAGESGPVTVFAAASLTRCADGRRPCL